MPAAPAPAPAASIRHMPAHPPRRPWLALAAVVVLAGTALVASACLAPPAGAVLARVPSDGTAAGAGAAGAAIGAAVGTMSSAPWGTAVRVDPGPWRWPVLPAPTVGAQFAPPPLPWRPGHRGVDLVVPAGTTVRSTGPGVVTFAGRVGGKPVVVVDHGTVRTTYEPVEAAVAPGDMVSAGSPIGRTVAVGGHCGRAPTCLHWGLVRGRTYLDPLRLLGRQPVVLKPPR